MSDSTTRRMIKAYNQSAAPTLFLSGFFQSPSENFHSSEEIEIDIERSDEEVAIVVQDLSTGHRMNSEDLYTNKSYVPPINQEAIAIDSFSLIKRMAGENPFESSDFRANLILRHFKGMKKLESKIRRAGEWQASRVMQTGTLNLKDDTGAILYNLSFVPKATHFPTVGTSWASATGLQKINDLIALAEINRDDGLGESDQLIFGIDAYENFFGDSTVQGRLDLRHMDNGSIQMQEVKGNGGRFRGVIQLGNNTFDVWTYSGRYIDPDTRVKVPFIDGGNVVVRSSQGRMDATFGAIPNISSLLGVNKRLMSELPTRFSNQKGGVDLHTDIWLSQNGQTLYGGVGTRQLMIPTAIDTCGCLTTQL